MQIQTKCPECGKIYDIDDEYVGAAVECEKCGTQFSVIRLKAQGKTEGEIMMSWRDCFLSWGLFFLCQGAGYFVAWLIVAAINALMVVFMVDESWLIDIFEATLGLVLTATASLLSFKFMVVKNLLRRIEKNGTKSC